MAFFSDFQYGFMFFCSTADLPTIVFNRNTRAFNRSGATQAIALDICKALNKVWHAGLLHKYKPYGIPDWLFVPPFLFLKNSHLWIALDGESP